MEKLKEILEEETLRNALSGGTAGLVAAVITCPLDMIKLRLQNRVSSKSTIEIFMEIWKIDGIRGLYRGVFPTAAGYLPSWVPLSLMQGIFFTVYDYSKKKGERHFPNQSQTLSHIIAALQAGLSSTILTNPIWVARTRIMTQPLIATAHYPYYYTSTLHALSTILKTEGWSALYKGLGPSLLGVSHVVVQFPLYEYLKSLGDGKSVLIIDSKGQTILLSSATSKTIASFITYPHEVVRTRLQTQMTSLAIEQPSAPRPSACTKLEKANSNVKYTGIIQTVKLVMKEEGFTGFYKGFGISLIRTVPASALTILTYELISRTLRDFADSE
ncbi:hypothetical protein HDV01_004865 [Terramyces sp. JEL0728]|nr:hypothetical protein HDV01_004865 [Terramyces sp. JEL0728]